MEPPTPRIKNSLVLIMSILLIITVGIAGLFYFQIQKLSKQLAGTQIQSIPTPTVSQAPNDDLTSWKTYSHNGISFQYPGDWTQKPEQLSGSGWSIEIIDPQQVYTVTFSQLGNYNQETGKSYTDLKEYTRMPYINAVIVDGQQANKTLPRAGSENDNQVVFFSKDTKSIYTLELDTDRNRIDKVEGGQKIFDQILSTFKFSDNEQTIYQCPTNGWQNCMPILTEEAKRGCTQEAIKWYETNCPNFQGVAQ